MVHEVIEAMSVGSRRDFVIGSMSICLRAAEHICTFPELARYQSVEATDEVWDRQLPHRLEDHSTFRIDQTRLWDIADAAFQGLHVS